MLFNHSIKFYFGTLLTIVPFLSSFAQSEIDYNTAHNKILFTENKNQWDDNIKYVAEVQNGNLFLEKNKFTYLFYNGEDIQKAHHNFKKDNDDTDSTIIHFHAFNITFKNGGRNTSLAGLEKAPGYVNYFIGNDRSKWAGRVKQYNKVHYSNLYNDIDLDFYSDDIFLEYDFIVKPHANTDLIQLEYKGLTDMYLENGNLFLNTAVNKITEHKPYAYQIIKGNKVEVPCEFKLTNNTISFNFPSGYNKNIELIIDPILFFSSYTGSVSPNWGFTATYDDYGNTYLGGTVFNPGFPVSDSAFQRTWSGVTTGDWWKYVHSMTGIMKFDTTGKRLWATYLGGNGGDRPHSLVVNTFNELLVMGTTSSSDFPTHKGTFDSTYNGNWDIFVAKLDSSGSKLLGGTYLGGSSSDGINTDINEGVHGPTKGLKYNYADDSRGEIITDNNGNSYISTSTQSSDFPTLNAVQNTFGGGLQDACIFKFDYSLSNLIWSTYLGGDSLDASFSTTLDLSGNVVVGGGTKSTNFPITPGAKQTTYGGGNSDGFVTKIRFDGTALESSTYWGTTDFDLIQFVQVNQEDYIFALGQAENSNTFYIKNALYNSPNSGQFITKFTSDLTQVTNSTSFGTGSGLPDITFTSFLVDVCDKIYIGGWGGKPINKIGGTTGLDITADAYQSTTDGKDFYFMVMQEDFSTLIYGTYFGGGSYIGEHVDGGTSRFDKKGIIYQAACEGCFGNSSFPTTPGVWSNTNNSSINCNAAALKLFLSFPNVVAVFNQTDYVGCAPFTNQFTFLGQNAATYHWDFGDGDTSILKSPVHTYQKPGFYQVELIISNPLGCNLYDTTYSRVISIGDTTYTIPGKTICQGSSVEIGATIPSIGVNFKWEPNYNLSSSNVSGPFASPDTTTTYKLIINAGFCADTIYQTVYVLDDTSSIEPNDTICVLDSVQLGHDAEPGNFTYWWLPANSLTDDSISQPIAFPTSTTTYTSFISNGVCADTTFTTIVVINPNVKTNQSDTICIGDSISIGNTPAIGDISYIWDPTSTLSNDTIPNPFAQPDSTTDYTLMTFTGFCWDTTFHTVNIDFPSKTNLLDTNICITDAIQIGFAPQASTSYRWIPAYALSDSLISNPIAAPDSFTSYILLANDGYCTDSFITNLLVIKDTVYNISDLAICIGDSIQIGIFNDPNTTFNWTPATGLSNSNIGSPNASPPNTTNYTISLTNSICTDTVFQTLIVNSVTSTISKDTTICIGSNINISASGGNSYAWTPNEYLNDSSISNLIASPQNNIIYSVIALDTNSNCFNIENTTILVDTVPIADLGDDQILCLGDKVKLNPGNKGDAYLWSTGDSTFKINVIDSGTYWVIVYHGVCNDIDSVSLGCPELFVPNAFSPNGDGNNDIVLVRGTDLKNAEIEIYDRWGNLVFASENHKIGWDGLIEGEKANQGVYVYYVKAFFYTGTEKSQKGNITLIR